MAQFLTGNKDHIELAIPPNKDLNGSLNWFEWKHSIQEDEENLLGPGMGK